MKTNNNIERFDSTEPVSGSLYHSLYFRILLPALIHVAVLVFFILIIAAGLHRNSLLLDKLQTTYYPVQSHLLNALTNIKHHNTTLEIAVVTGDLDTLKNVVALNSAISHDLISSRELSKANEFRINDLLNNFERYHKSALALAREIIVNYHDLDILREKADKNTNIYNELVFELNSLKDQFTVELATQTTYSAKQAKYLSIVAVTIGIAVAIIVTLVGITTANSVHRRMRTLNDSLKQIATGKSDLGVRIDLVGNDEMTELASWFNLFIHKLKVASDKSNEEMMKIAYLDFLSNLPNRRWCLNYLESESGQAIKEGTGLAVFIMDLDNFKSINDEYGHDLGDAVISTTAKRIHHIVSKRSTEECILMQCTGEPIVGRLGGDEFIAIIPGDLSKEELENVAQAICQSVSTVIRVADNKFTVGISVGIALLDSSCQERTDLVRFSDIAMYEAKRQGRNQYQFYTKSIADSFNKVNSILDALRDGSALHEFTMVYQPKFTIQDGVYSGAEALLRWNSERLGPISPELFIQVAEEHNRILDIDHWVVCSVLTQIQLWDRQSVPYGRIAINISAVQIRQPDFHTKFLALLESYSVHCSSIEIEITETTALKDIDLVKQNIHGLRSHGVSIAIDDFGAGHSSLQLLIGCGVDTLKIDRSIISQIDIDSQSASIVQSIVNLSEIMNITTVAEGVETQDQLDCLKKIHCTVAQGYFFSKPLQVSQIEIIWNVDGASHYGKAS